MAERRCRECGCTDERACLRVFPGSDLGDETCSWITPDLCSACRPGAGEGWAHPADQLRSHVYECCTAIAKGDASSAIAAILWAAIEQQLIGERDHARTLRGQLGNALDALIAIEKRTEGDQGLRWIAELAREGMFTELAAGRGEASS